MSIEKLVEVETFVGQVVGFRALFGYNRIAFVSQPNLSCTALTASLDASFISATGGESRIFFLDEELSVVERLKDYSPNLVVLSVGCLDEKLESILTSLFYKLMEQEVDSDFLFSLHSPTLVAIEALRRNRTIRNYLADKRVMAFALDSENGLIEIKDVYLLEDELYSEVVEQYPISLKLALIFSNVYKRESHPRR